MQVWLVESGEKHEGGSVRGVYKTQLRATRAAKGMQVAFDHAGEWEPVDLPESPRYPEGTLMWVSGCDWIKVTPREVL